MFAINPQWSIPLDEFRFTFARSGGPGVQNVNKLNTKVTLHWAVTTTPSLPAEVRERFCQRYGGRLNKEGQLVLQSQRFREQGRNMDDCLEKLRAMILAVAAPPKKRRPTAPSRGSKQRRLDAKKSRSQTKRWRQRPGD